MHRTTTRSAIMRPSPSRPARSPRSSDSIPAHWLFRSNLPPRGRGPLEPLYMAAEEQRRTFFGVGEIIGVMSNPAETVRSLTESRRLLDEARKEITESRERAQLRPAHTFSRLPGFFPRQAETAAIKRMLEGDPSFTVLFGASSVGKTALLREVLTGSQYHVLHFDLRIAGFADLSSLYSSLSAQMEQYFEQIAKEPGYKEFEQEAWRFKHDRLDIERRITSAPLELGTVKTSDIARLMEIFQGALIKYWEFDPPIPEEEPLLPANSEKERAKHPKRSHDSSEWTHVQVDNLHQRCAEPVTPATPATPAVPKEKEGKRKWSGKIFSRHEKSSSTDLGTEETLGGGTTLVGGTEEGIGNFMEPVAEERATSPEPLPETVAYEETEQQKLERLAKEKEARKPKKKIPVMFVDEAHKLPALIRSTDAMKCLLDAMLVLTKQDRLCHVVHSTSDPFYQTWLRQLNIMQHCKIITIGDCSKSETRTFFEEHLLPRVPESLRSGLDFEQLYAVFGGKLAHWSDYVSDYVNANGWHSVKQSTHFLQAHALLNLHIIHSSQLPPFGQNRDSTVEPGAAANAAGGNGPGFKIYSPISNPHTMAGSTGADSTDAPQLIADFSANQLLRVMSRLSQPSVRSLSYFALCRDMGVGPVDGMVKGRILELRWTDSITYEGEDRVRRPRTRAQYAPSTLPATSIGRAASVAPALSLAPAASLGPAASLATPHTQMRALNVPGNGSQTAVDRQESRMSNEWVPYPPEEEAYEDEEEPVVGPVLVPITPIMRYAMREVVQEYEDVQTVSEYASLTDVDPQEY